MIEYGRETFILHRTEPMLKSKTDVVSREAYNFRVVVQHFRMNCGICTLWAASKFYLFRTIRLSGCWKHSASSSQP